MLQETSLRQNFMLYQYRPKNTQCEQFDGLAARWLILFSLFLGFSPSLALAQAQTDSVNHILVLHGDFYERNWDREFDRYFSNFLEEIEADKVEISFQNFGLDNIVSPTTRAFYSEHIGEILREKHIDMIVAVLPTAVEFVLEIEDISHIPKVLVLPGAAVDLESMPTERVKVIESNSEIAIHRTLESALDLSPDARRVEIFSGAGQTDLEYMRRAEKVSQVFSNDIEFVFNAGLNAEKLKEHVSQVSLDSVALFLPYASTSDGNYSNLRRSLEDIMAASTVPVFSIVDIWLGMGIAGGYLFTVDKYAEAASQAASVLINGLAIESEEINVAGGLTFDHNEISAAGINLNRLNEPYTLVNRPASIFDDYSGFISTIGILGLLLCGAIAWQTVLLSREQQAKLKLQKSEKQARENQILFEMLTKRTLDVIWIWDSEQQKTTYCSPTIEQLSGYTSEEFLELSMFDAMSEASARTALEKVFSPITGAQLFEIELRKKGGELVCCEIAAQPMDDSSSNVQWVGITRDVSQRKNAEKEQLALQNQVRQAQKFESLGTLAGGIAHDFNNVLGIIMGLTELIRLRASDNSAAVEITDKLLATTDRAKAMVGQILAFSRQSSSSKQSTDLNTLLLESIQIMQTGIPKSISLNVTETNEPAFVLGDSNQLSQVFINVLSNAYEAVDEQQGTIEVSIFESNLEQSINFMHGDLPPGRYVTVQVKDNGGGLSEAELEKMFDPFYTSKELGNGMGLAISRGIVINHGGAIDINSEKGNGCTVFISLPLVDPENAPQTDRLRTTPSSSKATILLVDDQKDLLETISLMLQELGHKCICCSDPQQAIECLSNSEIGIDLVITDYSMPGMSGLDIREFSAQHRPNLPVVIATGYSERVAQDGYLKDNPHLVLSKPFGFAEIKEMLSRTLDGDERLH